MLGLQAYVPQGAVSTDLKEQLTWERQRDSDSQDQTEARQERPTEKVSEGQSMVVLAILALSQEDGKLESSLATQLDPISKQKN